MQELNLNRLNLNSPYTYWPMENNSYGFRTDYGVIYRVGFYENNLIWADDTYEFGINNENHKTSPNDKKVKKTILAIIEEFFCLIQLFSCINVKQEIIVRLCVQGCSQNGLMTMQRKIIIL